ncbi:haloacid dehalogenase-like hydrolase [Lysobacter sp. 13A]|uniref:Haloacid dehalogenase-like hydrolase n=2 Tax=Novilysobacter selenitireducens TaxID=2872639 RepID=A0ABS7T5G1_9GAMM|nr:haloacid dehalogenase-like hydrolase [Lysobacter selenitireducens]
MHASTAVAADPLPSWRDRASRQAIVAFVEKVTARGSGEYVEEAERIAVFDNDGTLWSEAPMPVQMDFVLHELKRRAPQEPELASDPMVQAALAGDFDALMAGQSHAGLLRVLQLTHTGMTTDDFRRRVRAWAAQYRHPRFGAGLAAVTYTPMRELLDYLRNNGFTTYIVSGGGADFMRAFAQELYGVPPEQVIGSTTDTEFVLADGVAALRKTSERMFIDDKLAKPVGIHERIGRRPVMAVGNSDGDQAMLEYTTLGNPHPSLGVLVHHTDARREYAYDASPPVSGRLANALAVAPSRGWIVVDMAADWSNVLHPH